MVEPGAFLYKDSSVGMEVELQRLTTGFFGGASMSFAKMTGPGRVYIQTLPFSRLADRIMQAYKGDREEVKRGGGALGALGDLIGGDS